MPPDGVGIQQAYEKATKSYVKIDRKEVTLPDDFQYSLPSAPREWLRAYGLTDDEIVKYRIGWSTEHDSLIFPAFDVFGNLLLYQRRKWPEKDFYTEGHPDLVDFIVDGAGRRDERPGDRTCVAVEDFISTIRVGRHQPTLCLWGSSLSPARIRRLANEFDRLIIWLDHDKKSTAVKKKLYAEALFREVQVVVTTLDPKACSDGAIRSRVACSEAGV